MKVIIKEIPKCEGDAYGQFQMKTRNHGIIWISKKLNKLVAEYGATLLHELLHFYFAALRLKGFKVSDRREHKAVYEAEKLVIRAMRKHCGKR